jgi:putative endonuclease
LSKDSIIQLWNTLSYAILNSQWYVYILECGDGSYYTGITTDVYARLEVHKSGKGARYTRGRGPLVLIYVETLVNRSEALKREYAIKKLSKKHKTELINKTP